MLHKRGETNVSFFVYYFARNFAAVIEWNFSNTPIEQANSTGTLEDLIKEKANVRAWSESSVAGIVELPVYVNIENFKNIGPDKTISVEAYVYEEAELTYRRLKSDTENKTVATSKVFNVYIRGDETIAPTDENKNTNKNVSTSDTTNIDIYMYVLLVTFIGIIFIKTRKEKN